MFSPSRCSARALLQSPSLASWLWVSTFRFIFNNLKAFCWIEIIWLPSPLMNIPFLWHGKLLGCFCSIFWIICTVMCSPVSFAAFGWIWVQHCTFCPATSSSSHKTSVIWYYCLHHNTVSRWQMCHVYFSLLIILVHVHLSLVQAIGYTTNGLHFVGNLLYFL